MDFRPSEDEQKSLNELSERKKILFDEYSKIKDSLSAKLHEFRLLSEEHPEDKELEISHKKAITEFGEAGNAYYQKIKSLETEMKKIRDQSSRRQFKQFNDDPQKILEDAKSYASSYIITVSSFLSARVVDDVDYWLRDATILRGDDGFYLLNLSRTKSEIEQHLYLHLEILQKWPDHLKKLNDHIDKILIDAEIIAPYRHPSKSESGSVSIKTSYPENFIMPVDKLTRLLFSGELEGETMELAMEKKGSKNEITTIVSVDFEKLSDNIEIKGKNKLAGYDQQIHDAAATLIIEGKNSYITEQMVYQVLTGDPKARLSKKQMALIDASLLKLTLTPIRIDASQDAKAYGFDDFKYEGNILMAEKITATLNGNTTSCWRFLRVPILYEIAQLKNQIGRSDIKLLNTPINKNEEIILLQGYLYRQISWMKNPKSTRSHSIVYDTIYKQLEIENLSEGALRKKKSIIRKHTKVILDYWKKEKFINGYSENKKGREIYNISISI